MEVHARYAGAGHDRDAVSCLYRTRVGVGLTIARQLPVRAAGALTVRGGPFSLNNRNADHSWAPVGPTVCQQLGKNPQGGFSPLGSGLPVQGWHACVATNPQTPAPPLEVWWP